MKHVLFIVAFLWGTTLTYSQDHSKCNDAIPITTPTYGPVTPEGWADSSLCEHNNPNMYFGESHKVVWFSFIAPYDSILTFSIVPENPADDFDFLLFKAGKGDFCQKEQQRKIQPIRTNFAKPTKANKGITGLAANATEAMVLPGLNNSFSSAVQIKKGEWYYIAVDNYANNKGGFTLKIPLRFSTYIQNPISTIDAVPIKVPPMQHAVAPPRHNFNIHVLDSAGHPIKATLFIEGIVRSKTIKVDTANYSLLLKKFQTVKIRANATGHMPYQGSYSGEGDTGTSTFAVKLEPIKSGEKITLKDIQFGENSSNILPSSKPALEYILEFLVNNPKVSILIKGYTNDPKHKESKKYDQTLSDDRAESVQKYFVTHHINKVRLKCIGYGSTKLVYPKPINEDQQAANRRVEIEIE